jgi:hypothetical protein
MRTAAVVDIPNSIRAFAGMTTRVALARDPRHFSVSSAFVHLHELMSVQTLARFRRPAPY